MRLCLTETSRSVPPVSRWETYRCAEAHRAIFYAANRFRQGTGYQSSQTDGSVTKTGDLSKTACAEALLAVQYNCNN